MLAYKAKPETYNINRQQRINIFQFSDKYNIALCDSMLKLGITALMFRFQEICLVCMYFSTGANLSPCLLTLSGS